MAGSAFKDPEIVAGVKRSFTPILVDGDAPENAGFAQKYGLSYYPSIVFSDKEGKAIEVLNGASAEAVKAAVARLGR